MKENTRFCTRSLRDNTRFGGVICSSELSPYPNAITASHGSYFANKIAADEVFDKQCERNIIQKQKLKAKQSTEKEVDAFVY